MLIRTQVQPQLASETIAAIRGHLEGVKGRSPISADELKLAQDMLTLSLPLEWETDEGIANAIAKLVRRGLPDGAIEGYVTGVRAVTQQQVEAAAQQLLNPAAMVWLIIGDRSKLEPQLKKGGIAFQVLTGTQ
jgi:zinc protease